ncbi:hypothetical protein PT285_01470 [Lactobacillus sp. ESL0791]|uniref:hypothetical protein n=1 Tax=Lactobacillus sp. ESL0791 TaxID=2983234 RepID=UPI0023F88B77|nr:hypothetical protein [Lactobacillus sp. ESL0791]MDF7638107.1 hypothetical protein [Lactobacillus sp. ESL0791]
MEIGSLSEWVTAAAEIAAVCVALFLPYYEKRQEKKKRTRNLKLVLRSLVNAALETGSTSNLKSYLKISYLINDNDNDKPIFSVAQQAITIIDDETLSELEKKKEIDELLQYLKK